MKIKRFFEALPVVAALLLTASCTNEDNDMLVPQPETPAVKTIPFTVTVSTSTDTRATVDAKGNSYLFEDGDALYIQDESGDVYGKLTLTSGAESVDATFSGELNYTGDEPEASLALTAVLKGKDDVIVQVEGDKVTDIVYPADAIQKPSDTEPIVAVASLQEAIQNFSYFKGTATYGNPAFTLEQQSAFLHFSISIVGEEVPERIDVSVVNNVSEDSPYGDVISYWDVELDESGKTEFYTALASGTKLENACFMASLSGIELSPNFNFGNDIELEANHVYKVAKRLVDLSWIKSDFEAQNNDVLFNRLANNVNFDDINFSSLVISIPANAKVTLSNAKIYLDDFSELNLPGITCKGDATIILDGENEVSASRGPGIFVASGNTLTIKGTGELQAYGGTIEEATSTTGQGAAGIGSGYEEECGNIVILEGTIVGIGGYGAPGIGSGMNGTCGDITFSGGDITAYAGEAAPTAIGIGTGGTCASVTIVNTISSIAMMNSDPTDKKVSSFINATKIQAHGGSNTLDIKSFATYNVDDANFATTGMNHVGLTSTYDSEYYTWTVSKQS